MKLLLTATVILTVALFLISAACGSSASASDTAQASMDGDKPAASATPTTVGTGGPSVDLNGDPLPPVELTEAEWRTRLTPQAFNVLREEGTERAFTSPLNKEKQHGIFRCGGCEAPLFASETKFESGTGWPSFYQPLFPQNVAEQIDNAYGMRRVEVECNRCGGHLGHVFEDGPKPTGLRYCINGAALTFEAQP